MKRVLCPELPKPGKPCRVPEAEAHHLIRVLRLESGDRVQALDGQGRSVIAVLKFPKGEAWLEFDEAPAAAEVPGGPEVILEVCVLKGEAMEWVIEKAVELGVSRLVPVLATRTIVQTGKKGPEAFQERWQRIADQALKQCGRLARMSVELPARLEDVVRAPNPRFFFDEASRADSAGLLSTLRSHSGPARLLLGPEGGWTDEERAMIRASGQAQSVSLGPLVLRAETAAIAAVSIVTAALRETLAAR
ncbi:MAG TPA: RsmE family RNA methyltransferase [Bdellovibrionota bacterium]|nr:RsmE family RNA methyltransferase [Bdellovibrionota bacterium]